jgi:hypothetical protein
MNFAVVLDTAINETYLKIEFCDLAVPAIWSDRSLLWSGICPFGGPVGSQSGPMVLWYDTGRLSWSLCGPVGPQYLVRCGPMGLTGACLHSWKRLGP